MLDNVMRDGSRIGTARNAVAAGLDAVSIAGRIDEVCEVTIVK